MDPEPSLADLIASDATRLRVPSRPDRIEPVVDFLVRRAVDSGAVNEDRSQRLMLALHEALTNSVIHGNLGVSSKLKDDGAGDFAEAVAARCSDPAYASRVVDVLYRADEQGLHFRFTDQGAGFDVAKALRRLERGPDMLSPSGRGLFMIRAFVDAMHYEDGGRTLTLRVDRADPRGRRRRERKPLNCPVTVAPLDAEGRADTAAARPAWAANVSASGVGLVQPQPLEHSRVLITFPTEAGPVSIAAEVRHWRTPGDNVVEIGCRFESALAPAGDSPLGRLLEGLEGRVAPGDEWRASTRVRYTATIDVDTGGRTIRAYARDLSRGGLAFFSPEPLSGEVRVCLPRGESQGAVSMRASVARCTRLMEEFYDVAVRFLD